MPQELVDVDAFTSPVRAPNDGDDADAGSIVQGLQPLADRTLNNRNRLTAHDTAIYDLQIATADPGTQKFYVHLAGGFNDGDGECMYVGTALLIAGDGAGNRGDYFVPIRLPQGTFISSIDAIIDPGIDPVTVELRRVHPALPTSTVTVLSTIVAPGGSAGSGYSVGLSPGHTVDNSTGFYELHIFGGTGAGTGSVMAVALTVTNLGSKNTQPL